MGLGSLATGWGRRATWASAFLPPAERPSPPGAKGSVRENGHFPGCGAKNRGSVRKKGQIPGRLALK